MMDVRKMASMGQRAMRKQQSKAEKVFWPLQAGRLRDAKPTLFDAVHMCQATANKLYSSMREAGLETKDAGCVLVCATKNDKIARAGLFTVENQDSCALEMLQRIHKNQWEPLGIAFCLRDREKGNLLSHARPFQQTERSERLLSAVLDEWSMDMKRGVTLRYD